MTMPAKPDTSVDMVKKLQFADKKFSPVTDREGFSSEAYDFDRSAEEVAKERGQVLVWPEPNQLQIDLDSEDEYVEFRKRMREMIVDQFDYHYHEHFSASGAPRRHVYLTFFGIEPFTEWQRVAIQSVLGSDPMREFLNVKRLLTHPQLKPSRLFETPAAAALLKADPPKSLHDRLPESNPDPIIDLAP